MSSLQGVVQEWDASDVIRDRLRTQHLLILPAPFQDGVKIDAPCGEHNYEALKPLVKRLKDPNGLVGMHQIPHLEYQNFG